MDDRHSWAETSDAPTQRQRTGWGAAAQGVQILPPLLTRAVILGRKSPEHWFPHFRTGNTNANDGLVCGSNYINNIKIPAQNETLAVTARSLHSDQPHARWRPGSRWARRRAHGPAGLPCSAALRREAGGQCLSTAMGPRPASHGAEHPVGPISGCAVTGCYQRHGAHLK